MTYRTYRFDGGVIKGKRVKKQKPKTLLPKQWSIVIWSEDSALIIPASREGCEAFWMNQIEVEASLEDLPALRQELDTDGYRTLSAYSYCEASICSPDSVQTVIKRIIKEVKRTQKFSRFDIAILDNSGFGDKLLKDVGRNWREVAATQESFSDFIEQKKRGITAPPALNSVPDEWSLVFAADNQIRVVQASMEACKEFWLAATETDNQFLEIQLEQVGFAAKGVSGQRVFLAVAKPEVINVFLSRVYDTVKVMLPVFANVEILLFSEGESERDRFLVEAVSYWQQLLKNGAAYGMSDSGHYNQYGHPNYSEMFDNN